MSLPPGVNGDPTTIFALKSRSAGTKRNRGCCPIRLLASFVCLSIARMPACTLAPESALVPRLAWLVWPLPSNTFFPSAILGLPVINVV